MPYKRGELLTWYRSDLLTAVSARTLLVPNLSRIAHVVMMMGFSFTAILLRIETMQMPYT